MMQTVMNQLMATLMLIKIIRKPPMNSMKSSEKTSFVGFSLPRKSPLAFET